MKLTIFEDNSFTKEIQSAIKNLVAGTTPVQEVKEKDGRSGFKERYVNGYYMFRQASLITGFRWSSRCLKERYIPNEENPVEVGALMEVVLFDQHNNSFTHQSWGSAEVFRYDNFSVLNFTIASRLGRI